MNGHNADRETRSRPSARAQTETTDDWLQGLNTLPNHMKEETQGKGTERGDTQSTHN